MIDTVCLTSPCYNQLCRIISSIKMDCVCNICSKRFPNQEKLGLHQYRIHSDKPFQCKLCGEKGNGANQYSNHMRKHKEPKSIQCEICQYESTDASNMNKHKKRHSPEKLEKVSKSTQNSCEPCGKSFPKKANFEGHMKVHLYIVQLQTFRKICLVMPASTKQVIKTI